MKKSTIILCLAGLFVMGLISCEKEFTPIVNQQLAISDRSFFKYANFTVNSSRNYLFVDNALVSGTASSFTSIYPSGSVSYIGISAVSRNFSVRDTLPTTTQPPIDFTTTLEAGSYYTLFSYDSVSNAKVKLVKDIIMVPADTTSRVRFANFAYSTAGVPNIDIFSTRRGVNVASNIPATGVTDFIPYASNLLDTLHIREAGKPANIISFNGFSPITKRSYTIVFRGSWRLPVGNTLGRAVSSFLSY